MKIFAVGFLLFGSSAVWMATPATADDRAEAPVVRMQATSLAPADAYFGRFQMSVLGIRNAIRDLSLRIDAVSPHDASPLYHQLTMVEDAILDLKNRFPKDSWIPQLGLSLAEAFAKMPFSAAQVHANDELDWIVAEYATTVQATYAADLRRSRSWPKMTELPIEPFLPASAVP